MVLVVLVVLEERLLEAPAHPGSSHTQVGGLYHIGWVRRSASIFLSSHNASLGYIAFAIASYLLLVSFAILIFNLYK